MGVALVWDAADGDQEREDCWTEGRLGLTAAGLDPLYGLGTEGEGLSGVLPSTWCFRLFPPLPCRRLLLLPTEG